MVMVAHALQVAQVPGAGAQGANQLLAPVEAVGRVALVPVNHHVEQQVARFFAIDKVFYQDNEIGEIVRNYLITSAKTNIVSLK